MLSHYFLNDLRLEILENNEISRKFQNCMETQSFAWSPLQVFSKSGQKVCKNRYQNYLTLSNSA